MYEEFYKKRETAAKRAARLGITEGRLHYYIRKFDLSTDEEILNEIAKQKKKKENGLSDSRAERLGISKNQLLYCLRNLKLKTDEQILKYIHSSPRKPRPPREQPIFQPIKKSYDRVAWTELFAELEESYPATYNVKTLFQRATAVDLKRRKVSSVNKK